MEFPIRLEKILLHDEKEFSQEVASSTSESDANDPLVQWNLDIEELFNKSNNTNNHDDESKVTKKQLQLLANRLAYEILKCCSGGIEEAEDFQDDSDQALTQLERMAQTVNDSFKNQQQQEETKSEDDQPYYKNQTPLFEFIRTAKNFLRWNLQIFMAEQQQQQSSKLQDELSSENDIPYPFQALQSIFMLEVVLNLLKWNILESNSQHSQNVNPARYTSLYLFYATYSINLKDKVIKEGMRFLLNDLQFPKVGLQLLCYTHSILVALSIFRNLHNLAVSYPNAAKTILTTTTTIRKESTLAAWMIDNKAIRDNEFVSVTLTSIGTSLALWCVTTTEQPQQEQQSTLSFSGTFPSNNPEDKRFELVVEILNTLYALRVGQQIVGQNASTNPSVDNTQQDLSTLVIELLKLSVGSDNDSSIESTRIRQCQQAACSLLMDSHQSFGKYLLEYHPDALEGLLRFLDQQVTTVVDQNQVDPSATSSLVPILVICNKYASSNTEFRQKVKSFVFPPDAEEKFQQKVSELQSTKSSSFSSQTNNMSPLDAPKDTLRGKLVQLLSWPESYIKRCTAEFMWSLCNQNATEYVHRVGMGNALPLLHAKGLASLPTSNNIMK